MAAPASTVKATETGADSPFPLTDRDLWVLSQTDEEYITHDWEDLKNIIGELVWGFELHL